MKYFLLKVISIVVLIFILVFFVLKQFNIFNKNKYEMAIINISKIEDKYDAFGIIYKDEIVLNLNSDGVEKTQIVKNLFKDGTKIGKDSKIIQIYNSEEEAKKYEKMTELEEELKDLKEIKDLSSNQNLDFIALEKQINLNYFKLLKNLKEKNFDDINDIKKNLKSLLNTRQLTINKQINFSSSVEKMKKEISKIENSIERPKEIFSPESGYFVSTTDGFEELCSIAQSENLNYNEFLNFLNNHSKYKKNKKNSKIIASSKIIFKAIVPTKCLTEKKIGNTCKIKFKENEKEVLGIIKDIDFKANQKNSLITFEIFDMSEKLATLRKSEAKIVFKEYEGFKIPKSAIHLNEQNKTCVYVAFEEFIKQKRVDILFEDENFFICACKAKNSQEDLNYLKNLDKIIVKGKNLYDNKRI